MSAEAFGEMDWHPLRGVDRQRLNEARLQAHHALQWLARAARAYVAPQPDDSQTSLQWDSEFSGFMTQRFAGKTRLHLQLLALTLTLHDGQGLSGVESFALAGRSDAQIRLWLGQELAARGLDQSALDAPSPYEIPQHAVVRGAAYDPIKSANALDELAAWYANAAVLLDRVRRQTIGRGLATSPLCCWPHHFDLAILIMLPTRKADTVGSVGCGLSPGDEYYAEPYFYVSVYPDPDPMALPALPAVGHWHTSEFTAAVVTGHSIIGAKDPEAAADAFLRDAVAAAITLVAETS